MKISTTLILLSLILISWTSCTVHKGQVISLDYGNTVRPENQAFGYSSASYFLGIGGNKTNVLLKEAKDNLVANNPLGPNQQYSNLNLDVSTSYFLIFTKQNVILSADITSTQADNESAIEEQSEKQVFTRGDSLFSKNNEYVGTFKSEINNSQVLILKNSKSGRQKLVKSKTWHVFKRHGSYKGYSIGEEVKFFGQFRGRGQIIGLGKYDALIRDNSNELNKVSYKYISKNTDSE